MAARIRNSEATDEPSITQVVMAAFGEKQGQEIAALISELLTDASAKPMLSLVALMNGRIIGHILFTNATVTGEGCTVPVAILGPLAILPEVQSQGLGGRLIQEGLAKLSESGVDLVFVLGHPSYYPRHGFSPAGTLGFEAPYPIPAERANAWMVQALRPGVVGRVRGRVTCADALNDPKHWRE
jgi:predicted N-acetyltransferase YhbS